MRDKGEIMKRVCVIVMLLLLVSATAVSAAEPREGGSAGLVTGLPFHIGATGEYNFGVASASLAFGYSDFFAKQMLIRLGGDYNFPEPFVNDAWDVDLYLSVGGQLDLLLFGGSNVFGIGVPVTLSYYFSDPPLKLYAKAAPEMYISGGVYIGFIGSLGVLYQL